MTIKHMQELRKQHAQRSKSDEKVRFKDMLSSAGASIDTSGKRGQIDNLDIQQLRYARSLYESVLVGVHIMMVVLTVFPSRAKEMWEEWCNEVPHTLRKGNKIKSPFPKKIYIHIYAFQTIKKGAGGERGMPKPQFTITTLPRSLSVFSYFICGLETATLVGHITDLEIKNIFFFQTGCHGKSHKGRR